MQRVINYLSVAILAVLFSACASAPQQSASTPAPVAPAAPAAPVAAPAPAAPAKPAAVAAASTKSPSERIIGSWNTNMQGQAMTLSYDGSNITTPQGPMPYKMNGDKMTLNMGQGDVTFTISFPSDSEFVSTDAGGQKMTFTRAK